jgi:CDP-glucose 4,6-dehydratase
MEDMGLATEEGIAWSSRGVLVTGAAGLLGRAISKQLVSAGAAVTGLDIAWAAVPAGLGPDGVERIDGDVRDSALVRGVLDERSIDTVIHLAAQTLVGPALLDPVATFRNNIEGTWVVLDACRSVPGVKGIIVASSDKAYGDWSGRPYREDMALRARHPYDVSKAAGDLIAQSYAATYRLPIAITRCGNLYGGGDLNWSRVVPGTIRSALHGERPVIRSDGTYVRDYLHVSDAAAGVLDLSDAVRSRPDVQGQAFNFASGIRPTVIDVVRRILALMDSPLEPVVLAKELSEIPEQRVSSVRAKRLLGWRPKVTLDVGLREAIDWYGRNLRLLT